MEAACCPDVSSPNNCRFEDEILEALKTTTLNSSTLYQMFLTVQNLIIQFNCSQISDPSSTSRYETIVLRVFSCLSAVPPELLVNFEEQIYVLVAFVNVIRRKELMVNQLFNEKGLLDLHFQEDDLSVVISKTLSNLWMRNSSNNTLAITSELVAQVAPILIELLLYTNDRTALEILHAFMESLYKQVRDECWPEHTKSLSVLLSHNQLNLLGHFIFHSMREEEYLKCNNKQ